MLSFRASEQTDEITSHMEVLIAGRAEGQVPQLRVQRADHQEPAWAPRAKPLSQVSYLQVTASVSLAFMTCSSSVMLRVGGLIE